MQQWQNGKIQGVGFDWDDVIATTKTEADWVAVERAVERMEREDGIMPLKIPFSADDKYPLETPIEFLTRIYGDKTIARHALNKQWEEKKKILLEYTGAVEGGIETMRFLKENNIPFFIATNNSTKNTRKQLDFLSRKDEFSNIPIFGPNEGYRYPPKPDPGMLIAGFKAIGVLPDKDNTLFIGNSPYKDMLTAARAGTKPILFTSRALTNPSPYAPNIQRINKNEGYIKDELDNKNYKFSIVENHQELIKFIGQTLEKPAVRVR